MSGVRVLVGTRKGAFVLSADGARVVNYQTFKRRYSDVRQAFFGDRLAPELHALVGGEEQLLVWGRIDRDHQFVHQTRRTLGDIEMPPVNGVEAAGIDRYQAFILAHRGSTLRHAALTRIVSSHRSLTFIAGHTAITIRAL